MVKLSTELRNGLRETGSCVRIKAQEIHCRASVSGQPVSGNNLCRISLYARCQIQL